MEGRRGLAERMAAARAWIARRALLGAALWILLGLEAVLLVAWFLAGPEGWGPGSAAPLLLDLALLAAGGGVLWWVRVWTRRELGEIPLTRHVERSAGMEPGAVRGPLELTRSTPAGVSPALARLGESRLLRSLPEDPASFALAPADTVGRWLGWGVRSGVVLALALVALLVLTPGRALEAWRGLATPMALAAQPVLPPLGVEPGNASVLRGEDLRVRISAPGRDSVFLTWEEAGAIPGSSTLAVGDGVAEHRYADVRSGFTYRVEGPDGAVAGPFAVDVLDPLILTALTIQLEFPSHTGLGSAEVVGDPPPLEIPRGTSITVRGRASRPLSRAALVGEGEDPARRELDVDGFGFRGRWTPVTGGDFAWVLLDDQNRPPEDLLPGLSVRIVEDRTPSLRFVLPASDTVLPVSRRQPLLLEALDDYGIDRLEVETWRVGSLGREGERMRSTIPGGGARDLLFRPVLDVSDWLLAPGDTVRVRAIAVDNRPGGGNSPVVELALWLPDEDALRQGAGEEMTEAARRLEEMVQEAEELGADARDQERQAEAESRGEESADPRERAREEALGFDQREELRRSLESERELMAAVDSLGAEMGALAEDLSEAGLPDAELQRQLDELESLLAEIADSGTRERLDSLASALNDMEGGDAQRALEDLGDRQSELREQLERALERFQQAAAQQEFRSATREAEALAREEELLATALEEGSEAEALADAQEDLSERAGDLEERLDELREQLSRMGDEPSAEQVSAAREQARMASEEMETSLEQMQAGARQEAASSASEASKRMSEAAQKLQQSQQEMAQRQMQEIQEAMSRVTAEALALARRQGGLQERMRSATQTELAELRGEQASVMEGLRNMAEQTAVSTREAPALGQQLSEAIGQAMRSVQETVQALERGGRRAGPSPYSVSELAVGSLNRIALQAMAGAQSLDNAGPGDPSQQLLEQLQQIAEQQGDLTNQSESVVPMELSQPAREAEARQIGEGQDAVAGELGELARDPGTADEALGDLQALAEAAEALARELESGRLDAGTVQRQEELFHRLLDAGRSLEKDEFADERRSRAPGEIDREAVEALGRADLGGAVIPFPDRTELEGLTPAQRAQILQYFERLNRTRGGTANTAGTGPGGGS